VVVISRQSHYSKGCDVFSIIRAFVKEHDKNIAIQTNSRIFPSYLGAKFELL
jgi:hypothetical protein